VSLVPLIDDPPIDRVPDETETSEKGRDETEGENTTVVREREVAGVDEERRVDGCGFGTVPKENVMEVKERAASFPIT
jgi:hypothetical protein